MLYRLRSLANPAWEVQVGTTPILVGRSRECHIKLSDPSGSRRHAQISSVNGELIVTDLNSALGTFVNHARVGKCLLKAGDIVAFGKEMFQVEAIGSNSAFAGERVMAGRFAPQAALQPNYGDITISIEERKEILEKEVGKYARQGWRIVSRTDTSVQLTRDKTASCLLALILAIFFILPAILYLLLYRGSENLYLEVDERGKITATR